MMVDETGMYHISIQIQKEHRYERKQVAEGVANDGKEKKKATPKRVNKIGRNDPCPCGSGRKYKQCCGK